MEIDLSSSHHRMPRYGEGAWVDLSIIQVSPITVRRECNEFNSLGKFSSFHDHWTDLGSWGREKWLSNISISGIQLHRKVCQLKYVKPIFSGNVLKNSNTDKWIEITHLDKWLCKLGTMQEVFCITEEGGLGINSLLIQRITWQVCSVPG